MDGHERGSQTNTDNLHPCMDRANNAHRQLHKCVDGKRSLLRFSLSTQNTTHLHSKEESLGERKREKTNHALVSSLTHLLTRSCSLVANLSLSGL